MPHHPDPLSPVAWELIEPDGSRRVFPVMSDDAVADWREHGCIVNPLYRGSLPEGFVAAPREPTEAMIEAACNAGPDTNAGPFSCDDARAIYRAMIQAQTDGAKALQDGRDG